MKPKSNPDGSHQPIAYSVSEACRVSSLGRTKIYQLISEGKLDADRKSVV